MNKLQQLKKFMIATFDGIHEKEGESPLQIKSKGGSLLDYRIYGNTVQEKIDGTNIIKTKTITLEGTEVDISVTGDTDLTVTEIYDFAFTTVGCTYTDNTLALFEVTYSDNTVVSVSPTESFKTLNEDGKTLTKIKCVNKCGCTGIVKNISCYTGRKPYKDAYSEISSVGDRTKNLFNISRDSNNMYNGTVIESGDDYFVGNMNSHAENINPGSTNSSSGWVGFQNVEYGTATAINRLVKDLKTNTTYTFSYDVEVLEFFEGVTRINPMCLIVVNGKNNQVYAGGITETNKKYHVKNTFTISDTIGKVSFILSLNSCKLKFSNPQLEEGSVETDYEPYGYKIPIIIKGKNLLYREKEPTLSGGVTVSANKSEWILDGTNNDSSKFTFLLDTTQYRTLKPGTYTLSAWYVSGTGRCIETEADKALILGLLNQNKTWVGKQIGFYNSVGFYNKVLSRTFTIEKEEPVQLYMVGHGEFSNYTFRVQIEEGKKYTSFEEHKEPINYTIFLDEPLRSINGKTDYIDFKTKKVIRNVFEKVVRGTDVSYKSPTFENSYGWNAFGIDFSFGILYNWNIKLGLCTYFDSCNNMSSSSLTKPYLTLRTSQKNQGINFATIPTSSQTLADFKEWVEEKYSSGNPLKVVWGRTEFVEEDIDLPIIQSLNGTTTIEIDTEIKPSNVYVKYKSL